MSTWCETSVLKRSVGLLKRIPLCNSASDGCAVLYRIVNQSHLALRLAKALSPEPGLLVASSLTPQMENSGREVGAVAGNWQPPAAGRRPGRIRCRADARGAYFDRARICLRSVNLNTGRCPRCAPPRLYVEGSPGPKPGPFFFCTCGVVRRSVATVPVAGREFWNCVVGCAETPEGARSCTVGSTWFSGALLSWLSATWFSPSSCPFSSSEPTGPGESAGASSPVAVLVVH